MLTLILQTEEGHRIELNVQPEDTFQDLKNRYADHELFSLSDSLEHLITNGASVAENTKIFDYVTGTAQEWFSTDALADQLAVEPIEAPTEFKACCARGCLKTEENAPGKSFFPLPTDQDRLYACLSKIGRLDLYDRVSGTEAEESRKYFLCRSHVSQVSSILPSEVYTEQVPTLSLLKPKNDRLGSHVMGEETLTKETKDGEEKKENDVRNHDEIWDVESDGKNYVVLELLDRVDNHEHPEILCRLCGQSTVNPILLFALTSDTAEEEFNLAEKINLCLPITVTVTDPLPKQICQDCNVKLNVCHKLALSCLQAEDKLKRLLREKTILVDASDKCPLCVEGDMRLVKKSGIYRREDTKNDFFSQRDERVDSSEEHLEDSRVEERSRISSTFVCESTNTDATHKGHDIEENVSLPLPNDEFSCSICYSRIPDVMAVKSHECQRGVRASYRSCVFCEDANYANFQELANHYSGVHGLCVKSPDGLDDYPGKRSDETRIARCCNCDEIFPSEEASRDHVCRRGSNDLTEARTNKIVGTKVRYSCHFCAREFTRKGSLEKHIKALHSESLKSLTIPECYKCKVCCEAFADEKEAALHARLKHPSSRANDETIVSELLVERLVVTCLYVCEYCEHNYTIPSSLHEHRESEHSTEPRYSCATCEQIFESHRQLATHKTLRSHRQILEESGIKQFYVCHYCDKTFLHRSSHSNHVLQHRALEMPYLCRICNLNFANYVDVSSHRDEAHPYRSTIHERSSLTYDCQYCCKQFVQEVALIKHIRMHTGERPHKCGICGKGFSQSSGLYTHMKIHSDLRPFSCTKCPRTFKIKGDRDNHIKKHAGNRPYKCEFCNKAFMTQHVYSQHCKIHTNERPYKCEICGQAFRRSHVLTVHIRRHTGEKPHVCDMCPKTYRQRGDLLKHRKVQHGIGNATKSIGRTSETNKSGPPGDSVLLPL